MSDHFDHDDFGETERWLDDQRPEMTPLAEDELKRRTRSRLARNTEAPRRGRLATALSIAALTVGFGSALAIAGGGTEGGPPSGDHGNGAGHDQYCDDHGFHGKGGGGGMDDCDDDDCDEVQSKGGSGGDDDCDENPCDEFQSKGGSGGDDGCGDDDGDHGGGGHGDDDGDHGDDDHGHGDGGYGDHGGGGGYGGGKGHGGGKGR